MPRHQRAFFIGMLGPLLQLIGVVWDLLDHGVFARQDLDELGLQHLLSGPSHLLMATGFLVAVLCIPVALEVATARPEDLKEPYESGEAEELSAARVGEMEWQQQ